jgi:hypothetical protein
MKRTVPVLPAILTRPSTLSLLNFPGRLDTEGSSRDPFVPQSKSEGKSSSLRKTTSRDLVRPVQGYRVLSDCSNYRATDDAWKKSELLMKLVDHATKREHENL